MPNRFYTASPSGGLAPLDVSLNASSSYDPDGSIASYQWAVNGKILSGETTSITFDKAGSYPIVLTVIDNKGAIATKTYTITVKQPVKSGVRQVSRGGDHTCALKYDGSITCWGGDPRNKSGANLPPDGNEFTQISMSGYNYACALKNDASIFCWGNYKTELLAKNFTQIETSSNVTCALDNQGRISCWDNSDFSSFLPTFPTDKTPATLGETPSSGIYTQISISNTNWNPHACALRNDGGIDCWGWNNYKQSTPPNGTFIQVSAGKWYTCALNTEGKVICWGNKSELTKPPSDMFIQINSPSPRCGIKEGGSIACWGGNMSDIPEGNFTQLSCDGSCCAVKDDNTVACWGKGSFGETTPPSELTAPNRTIIRDEKIPDGRTLEQDKG